jgi:cytochrome c oxidase cbb3-type subunit IV
MSYDQLRHLADSYGLIAMGVLFTALVGWTFRKGADAAHHRASQIIFDEEDRRHG